MAATIFEAAGGAPAMLALAGAWHRRCLEDPVVEHPFSHGVHPQHVRRLAAYWGEALGGPAAYTGVLGTHESVLRLHAGNGVHEDLDERAVGCFVLALDDARLPGDPRLREALTAWFRSATAAMAAYPGSPDDVPAGVPLPRWDWSGSEADGRSAGAASEPPPPGAQPMQNRNLPGH